MLLYCLKFSFALNTVTALMPDCTISCLPCQIKTNYISNHKDNIQKTRDCALFNSMLGIASS